MARTKEIQNATRRHIWFDDDRWEWIKENFEPRGIGPSFVIRQVMGAWIDAQKAKAAQQASPVKGDGSSIEEVIAQIQKGTSNG